MDVQALRALIRQHISLGELPRTSEHQIFDRPGDGTRCVCCAEPIGGEQVQHEAEIPTADGDTMTLAMHAACYSAWREECERPASPAN